ncbi:energy transducer TonB [Pontibacter toksunensis]|uniref:Energy transducer TonB n=1 Tax=Pontibacter toksunensis TaxID=1332631 RepID=A0ABW6C0E0_9BACT
MKKHNILHQLYKLPLPLLLSVFLACSSDEEPIAEVASEIENQTYQQEDPVYREVEQTPVFYGGEEEMFRFLHKNIRFPEEAKAAGVEGMVVLKFRVEKDGSITDLKLEKNLHPEIDKEALRLAKMTSKKWYPGLEEGEFVRVRYTLPIRFTIK